MGISYKEYNEKYRLPEQARDEQLLLKNKHHILCYEPGKGKSMPIIHCLQVVNRMKGGQANVLILSDATCIRDMWKAEIQHMGVLPKNTTMCTDRSAIISPMKEFLLKTKWDVIVCDECYHPDTEVLTNSGWKKFTDLTNTDLVAQYENENIEFVKPLRIVKKDFNGDLECLSIDDGTRTFKVTPNHNMVYRHKHNKKVILEEAIKNNKRSNYEVIVSGFKSGSVKELTSFDRVAIMLQADGYMDKEISGEFDNWQIQLRRDRKIERCLELLTKANIYYTEVKSRVGYRRFLIKIPKKLNISKSLKTYFKDLEDVDTKWCEDFIEELSKWDGHFDKNRRFYQRSVIEENIKFIESILTMCGYYYKTSKIIDKRSKNAKPLYRVMATKGMYRNYQSRKWSKEYYNGKVYCVEVPSSKILVRSPDGTAIVCGNCQSLRSGVTRSKSQYAKLVYQLCSKTEYVWGMTGTIAGNNNIEPFCVLHALHVAGLGQLKCGAFKERYCIKELQYGPFGSFTKPTKLNKLGEELLNTAYKRGCSFWDYDEKDEMPELDITVKEFEVPMTKTYVEALNGILKCDEHESTVIKAIAIQKAQQALNGFVYYDLETERKTYLVPEFENPKLNYVVERCRKEVCIIAYRYQEDAHYIAKHLDKAGIKHCDKISEFKERLAKGEHIILILQCSRGKAANLQQCQHIIYYTADHSFIYYKQMIHRCWRRGQKDKCSVTFLVNNPGDEYKLEQKLWTALRRKQSISDTLMSIKNK